MVVRRSPKPLTGVRASLPLLGLKVLRIGILSLFSFFNSFSHMSITQSNTEFHLIFTSVLWMRLWMKLWTEDSIPDVRRLFLALSSSQKTTGTVVFLGEEKKSGLSLRPSLFWSLLHRFPYWNLPLRLIIYNLNRITPSPTAYIQKLSRTQFASIEKVVDEFLKMWQ